MKRLFGALLLLVVLSTGVMAQPIDRMVRTREQTWTGYFNQTRLTKRVGLWMDIHYRQTDQFFNRPFQFLVRPAISFYLKDNLRVHTGYALIEHFPARGLNTTRPEHRSWQQIWWNQKYGGFSTLQWLRLEQRFNRKIANDVLQPGYARSHRLRYNFTFFVPLKGKELAPKTTFVVLANEVFFNLGGSVVYNTFDQNRFFIGLGYQVSSRMNIQGGYMNVFQQEAAGNSYWSSHAIRLFVFHNLDFRQAE